jgi:hypothetical protein
VPARTEALVEHRPGASLDALPDVELRQLLPPGLAVVTGAERDLRALERLPGVLAVHTERVPDDVVARMDEPARTFAAAWNERRRPKRRRGDGLPWDTPGFDAP